jgi:predicted nucleic acid-binding protein
MAELVRTYEDARLDPADVSVVAIAERLAITHIATLDRRDFLLMRPRHVPAFRLLPETLS